MITDIAKEQIAKKAFYTGMYIVPFPPLGRGDFFQVIWEGFPVVEVRKEENRKGKGRKK